MKRNENRDEKLNQNRRSNAWKRYGAMAMAGMLLVGAAAAGAGNAGSQVSAEETEKRITLNIAQDDEEEAQISVETEQETEKRVTLNSTSKEEEETEEAASADETEAESEEAAEAETESAEAAGTEELKVETKETYAPIESAGSTESGVITTDVSGVVENCMPSIVAITGKSVEEIETYYYGKQEFEAENAASGIIVAQNDEELLIATNSHVVAAASDLNVCFTAEAEDKDDLVAPAKIKGMDKDNELAVVAVQLSDIPEGVRSQLKIAKLGSSDDLKVGQAAIAIGNALGYGQSVTCGIISALNREISIDDFSKPVIMTDAAINFGNSGGALLNAKGEVVGINVAKEAGEASESMGYSIPIDTAIPILNELVNRETRDKMANEERGYLGATVVNVSEDAKELYNMPQGAFVYEVTKDSAAEKAGIRKGDIITKFDGLSVTSSDDLIDKMGYYEVGETVTIEVQSANSGEYESREVEVTLQKGEQTASSNNDTQSKDDSQDSQDDGSGDWNEENPFDGGYYEDNGGSWFEQLPFGNGGGLF